MAGKEIAVKKYVVRLSVEERERLQDLIRSGTHEAGVKFQRVIKKIRRHLFVFTTNRALPPTNNGSERSLRPCVTYRKITNGFRTS